MTDPTPPRPPPERLTRLSLAGFRSIRELDLELGDLTVLIGANGAGKSNLVAFFNLLSAVVAKRLQRYVQTRGGASSILHYGPKSTPELTAQLTFERSSTYSFSLAFAAPDRLFFAEEQGELHPSGSPSPLERSNMSGTDESLLVHFSALDTETVNAAHDFLRRLEDLRVYHFHDTSEHAPLRLTQELGDNRILDRNGANLAAFLYMLRESYPGHYTRIIETVRLAVPYLHDLVLEPDRLARGKIQLRWRDRNGDYELGPHQLSDGSLRAIALITALMQPEELLPALITIDEPELGLHPSAVTLVAQLIKAVSRKRQVIVATQSPRLIAGFEPEDIVVVEREEDERARGYSTFKRLTRDDLGDWLDSYDLGQLYDMNVTGGGPQ